MSDKRRGSELLVPEDSRAAKRSNSELTHGKMRESHVLRPGEFSSSILQINIAGAAFDSDEFPYVHRMHESEYNEEMHLLDIELVL